MRVIGGQWRGRPLVAPAGQATRPTADRTRETLFSMLTSRIGSFEGLRVADLFAGSGALGIEALSRGAAQCTFVDNSREAVAAIRANLDTLGASDLSVVKPCDGTSFVGSEEYDLILADPPYSYESAKLVKAIADAGVLASGGWLAVETERGHPVDGGAFAVEAGRDVGRARITLLRNG